MQSNQKCQLDSVKYEMWSSLFCRVTLCVHQLSHVVQKQNLFLQVQMLLSRVRPSKSRAIPTASLYVPWNKRGAGTQGQPTPSGTEPPPQATAISITAFTEWQHLHLIHKPACSTVHTVLMCLVLGSNTRQGKITPCCHRHSANCWWEDEGNPITRSPTANKSISTEHQTLWHSGQYLVWFSGC